MAPLPEDHNNISGRLYTQMVSLTDLPKGK